MQGCCCCCCHPQDYSSRQPPRPLPWALRSPQRPFLGKDPGSRGPWAGDPAPPPPALAGGGAAAGQRQYLGGGSQRGWPGLHCRGGEGVGLGSRSGGPEGPFPLCQLFLEGPLSLAGEGGSVGGQPVSGSPEALWLTLQLPPHIRASPEVSAALAIHGAFLECNFARFFRLARELPYLQSCALKPHLACSRRLALLTFSHGFSAKNCRYPLARLARLLAFDSPEEAADECRAHGLALLDGSLVFQKGSFRDAGPLRHRPARLLVEGKWRETDSLLELSETLCSS
ncbi:SAC3 domain-containing protein 1 [Hemicordylus capensis]|uniref:SAC3 domain-containing protein 1 n=1 Tax=Hemicordylus capensis TaxID=884348 RepID=UPI0023036958|nr:SAC3 domain-containing protein 1 [Hemicordylus capensis]